LSDAAVEFCKIAPALEHLRAPIGAFQRHPENARIGNVEVIAQSLTRFGQLKPIVVQQSTGYIVAGNHTFLAANQLKWSHIASSVVDMDEAEARAYLVADNATSDLADYKKREQAETWSKMFADGGQMAFVGTGIEPTQDNLDIWAALANGAEIEPDVPFKGDYATGPEPAVSDIPGQEDDPAKPPMREVVMLMEIVDAQLMATRLKNLQKQYPEGGGLTATILRAVATAHEHFYGSADPAAANGQSAPENASEEPAA
jgi:hypothetical protein